VWSMLKIASNDFADVGLARASAGIVGVNGSIRAHCSSLTAAGLRQVLIPSLRRQSILGSTCWPDSLKTQAQPDPNIGSDSKKPGSSDLPVSPFTGGLCLAFP